MLAGGLVALVHWLAHIEAFGPQQHPLWLDLVPDAVIPLSESA
jgi:hypothetical protein